MLGRLSLTVPPEEGKVIMSISPTILPWQTLTLAVIVPVFICIHLSISVCKLCVTSFRYRACTNIYLLLFFLDLKIWWDWRIKAVFINWLLGLNLVRWNMNSSILLDFRGCPIITLGYMNHPSFLNGLLQNISKKCMSLLIINIIKITVYRVIVATCYFRPSTLANIFAPS